MKKPLLKRKRLTPSAFALLVNNNVYRSIIGDLDEEYALRKEESSLIKAIVWYWFQIIKATPSLLTFLTYWSIAMFNNYFKIALRNLTRKKGFSFINITGLSFGLGCFILLFLYVSDEWNFDSIHTNKDNIYRVNYLQISDNGVRHHGAVMGPMGDHLVENYSEVINRVRLTRGPRLRMFYENNNFHEGAHLFADPSIFEVFGFELTKGDKNTVLEEPNTVVLTEEAATKYFGDEDPINKILSVQILGDVKVTGIIKKIPENSHLYFNMLFSMATGEQEQQDPRNPERRRSLVNPNDWREGGFTTYILLDEKADIKNVEAKLSEVFSNFRRNTNDASEIYLQSMHDLHFNSGHVLNQINQNQGEMQYIIIISVIAAFILFIACFNFMNLSTARSADRAKEVGLRKVIGANKSQLIKQILGESILIVSLAFVVSLVLAKLGLPYFNALSGKNLFFNSLFSVEMFFALLLLIIGIGMFAGSYPAFVLSALRPISLLRGGGKSGGRGKMLRQGLVVLQFTMSIIMIVGTLIVFNQLGYIRDKKIGLNKDQLITIEINTGNIRRNWFAMREQFLAIPAITNAAVSMKVPFGRQSINATNIVPEGYTGSQQIDMKLFTVDDNFVDVWEIEIAEGNNVSREFGKYEQSALLNEAAVAFLGWDEPVGKKITVTDVQQEFTVVGVTRDFHYESLHSEIEPLIMPVFDRAMDYISLKASTKNLGLTIEAITAVYTEYDADRPIEWKFVDDTFEASYRADKKVGSIFIYSAIISIVIASLGLFGLSIYTIERRSKEIGIRKVLGSSVNSVVLLLSKEFVRWIILANAVAWPIVYGSMEIWLNGFAYRTSINLMNFIVAGTGVLLLAMLTVGFQAFKAARANPVNAIRNE